MKICFFGYMNITKKEGASLSLLNVMEEMVRRGHEVYFVVTDEEIIPQMNKLGVRCITLLSYTMRQNEDETGLKGAVKYKLKDIINRVAIWQGIKKLKGLKIDAIHINGIDNHVGAAIATRLNIPYFWHIRQFLQEDLGKKLVGEEVIVQYLRKADGVIGISEAVKKKFESILGRPVKVIYNGIPLRNYDLGDVVRFASSQIKILFAGRITENKGQMEAVKAISLLRKRGITNVSLILVGNAETSYLEKIKKIIRVEKIEDSVTILDYCEDLNEFRRISDIGLVCSKNEAFGRVTVEYMCAEMLVIGANTGGTVELVENGKTGLLYQQADIENLADIIQYAIQNPEEMQGIAKKGKEYALNGFSIKRVCDEILDLYAHPYNIENSEKDYQIF